jgi:hypothetical protein
MFELDLICLPDWKFHQSLAFVSDEGQASDVNSVLLLRHSFHAGMHMILHTRRSSEIAYYHHNINANCSHGTILCMRR